MAVAQPINEEAVIRLPGKPTDADILGGVRRWLELLAIGDYKTAVKAFYFRWGRSPESLQTQIEELLRTRTSLGSGPSDGPVVGQVRGLPNRHPK